MQALNLQLRGLYTHPNPLSEVPPGALLKAKNMVMDKEGIIETRRGFKHYGDTLTGAIKSLFNYNDTLLVHHGSTLSYDSDKAGHWHDYSGTFDAPTGANKIQGLEASKNFFFTTSAGVYKIDAVTGTPAQAGGIKALDGTAALTVAGSGFFTLNNQLAYRIVWGIKDANENLILGSPSQRIIVINPAGGASDDTVDLTFTIPAGITTSHFYQIYRSVLSGADHIVPNDELGLVIEDNPDAPEIAAGHIHVTDSTPETLRGATLYTSPSQQGILQSNDPPPLAKDLAFYKNAVLYANTVNKQRINITLIAVSTGVGVPGIAVGDTVKIGATTYTAAAAEDSTAGEFYVETGLTAAENIDSTAQSLVRVINQYASNTVYYAYYMSGYNDLPGMILIEERSIGGASLALISSNGAAFNPTLPAAGTSISTSNDTYINRIYVSKQLQPEAVPISNYIEVGSASKKIVRVIPLRDSVFVFKEDGLYRITGESIDNFSVSLFDVTVVLNSPDTAVPFNNQIFAYTSQGVVGISDTGSGILSRPIEVDLLEIATFTSFNSLSFGVSYNSDRKYVLFIQKESTDTYPTQAYVYNALSQQWTRWERNFTCGLVNSDDDLLYFGSGDSTYVYQERKSFTLSDYADEEMSVTLSASTNTTTVTMASTTGIVAGDVLYQSGKKSVVVSVDSATTVTVEDVFTWKATTATVYKPISVEVETIQQHTGNPGILKHFRDIAVIFRKANFTDLTIGIKSDLSNFNEDTDLSPINPSFWGGAPWGSFGWGGGDADYQLIRTYIPRNKQRGHWILVNVSHSNARDYFAIAGMSLQYAEMSERMR